MIHPRFRFSFLAGLGLAALAALPLRAQTPLFAEDFESGALDPAVWETRASPGVEVTVQQGLAAHGKSALQIHYPKGKGRSYAFIVATHVPADLRTHCFGRAYVFIRGKMPAGHDVLLNAGTAGYPTSNFLELGASGGKNVMMSYQQNGADVPRGETIGRGTAYPVNRWFCLEWEFGDQPDHIAVWIDGQPAGDLSGFTFTPKAVTVIAADGTSSVTATGRPPAAGAAAAGNASAPAPALAAAVPGTGLVNGFADFAFGFRAWGGGAKEDFDLFYDDLALGSQRLGPVQ